MKSLQKYEKQIQELARLVNVEDYIKLQLEHITADTSFDEIAFYAGLTSDMERRYSLYKDQRYAEQYKTILQNIAQGFSRSQVGIVPMQILRCIFLFEHFQVTCNTPELAQLEQNILEDLEEYNPETLEYKPLVRIADGGATDGGATDGGATDGGATAGGATAGDATADGGADGATDGGATADGGADGATDGDATADGGADAELWRSFDLVSKSQARFFYTHIQLYYVRTLLGTDTDFAVRNLIKNIAKVYTPKVLSPAGYRQTLDLIFGDILKKDYATYIDTLESCYLKDDAPLSNSGAMLFAPSEGDTEGEPSGGSGGGEPPFTPFWDHAPEVQTSTMLWSFHVLLDHCGSDADVVPRLYDIINTLHTSLIKAHSGSVSHLNAALLITYYHRLVSDHMAALNATGGEPRAGSSAEDVLQAYIQRNMEPLDTPRNDSSERVLRVGLLAYSLPNNEYSALLFKIATHLKLFDEDFSVYLYNEQSFRSSSDAGVEHQFKALLGDNYYAHSHPLYSTFAENAEGIRNRIERDNLDILIFTHMEYTENYIINLRSAPCQIYLSLFDKMYSSSSINSTIAVSDGYRQVSIGNTIVETFTIETPLTMTPTTTPDNQLRQLLRGIY